MVFSPENRLKFVFCISLANTGHLRKLHLFGDCLLIFMYYSIRFFRIIKTLRFPFLLNLLIQKTKRLQTHNDNHCWMRDLFQKTHKMQKSWVSSFPRKCSIYYKTSLWESQVSEKRGTYWRKEDEKLVEKNHVREYLSKPDIHKFIIYEGIHPQFLRELADVIDRKVNAIPVFRQGMEENPGVAVEAGRE